MWTVYICVRGGCITFTIKSLDNMPISLFEKPCNFSIHSYMWRLAHILTGVYLLQHLILVVHPYNRILETTIFS